MKKIKFMVFISLLFLLCVLQSKVARADGEYYIKINVDGNCMTIYKTDDTGEMNPVAAFACTMDKEARNLAGTVTSVTDKRLWKKLEEGKNLKNVLCLENGTLIGSSLFSSQSDNALIKDEFNKIASGEDTDEGIYLYLSKAEWLVNNCDRGTVVEFYSDKDKVTEAANPPLTTTIGTMSKYDNWDPTDTSKDNPWKEEKVSLKGVKNKDIKMGTKEEITASLLKGVTAYDKCGNDISDNIFVSFSNDLTSIEGVYSVIYSIKDVTDDTVTQTVEINVKKSDVAEDKNDESEEADINDNNSKKNSKENGILTDDDKMRTLLVACLITTLISFALLKLFAK